MTGTAGPQYTHIELLQSLEWRGQETQRLTAQIKFELDLLGLEKGEPEVRQPIENIKFNVNQLNIQFYHMIREGACLHNMEARMRADEAQGKRMYCFLLFRSVLRMVPNISDVS